MSEACVEEGALPSRRAPRPLTPGPNLREAHPLLDVSLTPDRGGGILRTQASERRRVLRQVRFEVGNEEASGNEESGPRGVLAAPTMHSSAALQQEVEAQSRQEFDADGAVRSELERSYRVRRGLESRAARALNVGREQSLFQGLVSVEPPSDQLQRLSVQQRRAEHRGQPASSADAAPDIWAFSDAMERFTETPYLTVDGLPPLTLRPHTRPPHSTFTMFHKLREWAS